MFKPSPSQPQSPAKLPETDQKEVTSVLDENGANEKRPKKGRILTLSKIGITKSKDHGTSIQNAGLEYFCNTYFKLEKELLIRAQYFFDKGSI